MHPSGTDTELQLYAPKTSLEYRLHGNAEHVTDAALGADIAGVALLGLDLAAEPHDLDVDRAVVHLVVVEPREIEQLVAAEDAVRSAEQHDEQAELAPAEDDRAAVRRGEPPRVEIELPTVKAIGAYPVGPALAHLATTPAEHGANARKQLSRAERLGEIVVGAELETHHAVGFVAPAGEHNDRNRRFVAQPARKPHAV